jgi:hypothetical protein
MRSHPPLCLRLVLASAAPCPSTFVHNEFPGVESVVRWAFISCGLWMMADLFVFRADCGVLSRLSIIADPSARDPARRTWRASLPCWTRDAVQTSTQHCELATAPDAGVASGLVAAKRHSKKATRGLAVFIRYYFSLPSLLARAAGRHCVFLVPSSLPCLECGSLAAHAKTEIRRPQCFQRPSSPQKHTAPLRTDSPEGLRCGQDKQ